jgi:hypothetical protein
VVTRQDVGIWAGNFADNLCHIQFCQYKAAAKTDMMDLNGVWAGEDVIQAQLASGPDTSFKALVVAMRSEGMDWPMRFGTG